MIDALTDSTRVYAVPAGELTVDRARLERILGYDKTPAPEPVVSFLDEAINITADYIDPQCALRILPPELCSFSKRSITVGGVEFVTQPIISKRLKSCEALAIFVCSIGPRMEQQARLLMEAGKMLEGFLLDQVASEIVEQAADWTEQKLSEIVIPMGWKMTNRYSPGYCKWSVAEQHKLFSFFPPRVCGIELTKSSLMIPIKSVTGVIGIGPKAERDAYECTICDMSDCFRRKQ
jgi:hypothetical protein